MNEVRPIQVTGLPVSGSASLNGRNDLSTVSSNKADVAVEEESAQAEVNPPVPVSDVVASMNEYVQSIERDLQFSVDEETEKTVIKVIDGGSGELIRQIPEETFLELARKLNEDGNFQLIDALG